MTTAPRPGPDPGPDLVAAAQGGDERALEAVVAASLPLVSTIVARALRDGPDVDDVVQDTLVQVVRHLGDLRTPDAYRSWLVAITVRQLRAAQARQRSARARQRGLDEVADRGDPLLDVGDEAILHLQVAGERRELAEAVRWLDADDRTLLSLWWLEETGHLDRAETVASLGQSGRHVAVRLQRLRERLDATRTVVRALRGRDRCGQLAAITRSWDGRPSGLWRKRVWRHVRTCPHCRRQARGLLRVEALLGGVPLVAVPADVTGRIVAAVVPHGPAAAALTAAHGVTAIAPGTTAGTTAGSTAGSGTAAGSGTGLAALPGRAARALRHLPGQASATAAVPAGVAAVVVAGVVAVLTLGSAGAGRPATTAHPAPLTAAATATVPVTVPATPSPSVPPTTASRAPVSPLAAPTTTRARATGAKKGVGAWSYPQADAALADSGASWYYTWAVHHQGIRRGSGFVPMIRDAASVTAANLSAAAEAGPYLLGFNEPDLAAQANLSVEDALALWPRLQSAGRILGSPAVATGADVPGGWLDRFMTGARQRGYRVDFVAVHWYGGDFDGARATAQLQDYLRKVWARYHKPIWLTEYALVDFSHGARYPGAAQQRAFVLRSTAMLQSLPYVQRYAWFGLQHSATCPTGLYDGARPTPWGTAFRGAG